MKKRIFLFLNNKLLTADTAIPLLVHIKYKLTDIEIIFFTLNQKTYDEINKNIFLSKLIHKIGVLKVFTSNSNYKFIRIIKVVACISYLCITSFFRKNIYMHFKVLENFYILYFTNRRNSYYIEPNPWGYIKNLSISDNIFYKRANFKKN